MANKNAILKNENGDDLYPVTYTSNVYNSSNVSLDNILRDKVSQSYVDEQINKLNKLVLDVHTIGTIIISSTVIESSGLHLADGGELAIGGTYDDFCQYVISNQTKFPTCSLTEWQTEFDTYGQCGKYVITDTYIKLPYITKLVGSSVNLTDFGTMNEAGLPNITAWGLRGGQDGWADGTNGNALKKENTGQSNLGSQYYGSDYTFDASRSSSIYGKSSTVETEYIKYLFYIVIGTVIKPDISVDINNITSDLNLKLSKTECVRYPVSKFVSSDGMSWYIVYNDDWKECGGTITANGNVYFPIQFTKRPNINIGVVSQRAASAYDREMFPNYVTTEYFTMPYFTSSGATLIDYTARGI